MVVNSLYYLMNNKNMSVKQTLHIAAHEICSFIRDFPFIFSFFFAFLDMKSWMLSKGIYSTQSPWFLSLKAKMLCYHALVPMEQVSFDTQRYTQSQ